MKMLFLTIVLLPLGIMGAQTPQELIFNNYSGDEVTVYYTNLITRYKTIESCKSFKALLSELPQRVTIHFNQIDRQQDIWVTNTRWPISIIQLNQINIKQNGENIVPAIVFDSFRPTY